MSGAVRTGREEVFVPREMGPVARLIAGSPPALGDRLKRLINADSIMAAADMSARVDYRRRMADSVGNPPR